MQNMNKIGKLQQRLKYSATVWTIFPVLKIKGWAAARVSEGTTQGSAATQVSSEGLCASYSSVLLTLKQSDLLIRPQSTHFV